VQAQVQATQGSNWAQTFIITRYFISFCLH
jgi:hypothetical protein